MPKVIALFRPCCRDKLEGDFACMWPRPCVQWSLTMHTLPHVCRPYCRVKFTTPIMISEDLQDVKTVALCVYSACVYIMRVYMCACINKYIHADIILVCPCSGKIYGVQTKHGQWLQEGSMWWVFVLHVYTSYTYACMSMDSRSLYRACGIFLCVLCVCVCMCVFVCGCIHVL